MTVRSSTRVLGAIALTLSGAACSVDCSSTSTTTTAAGTVRDARDAVIATTTASVSEYPGAIALRTLEVTVRGNPGADGLPLRGHLTRARLVGNDGELLAEVPLSAANAPTDIVTHLASSLPDAAAFARLRSALLTGRVRLVLDTDVAGLEHLESLFFDVHDYPPTHRTCPYT